mgnify:CR=1 FL=1
MAKVEYNAVGRRKTAIARVRLVAGDGKIVINKRDLDEYFGLETLKNDGCEVTVYSDSQYVVNAVEKGWVFG